MASTAVHIADMGAAIRDGTVPGRFSADRTVFAFPTLEYAGSRAGGATHLWTIRVRLLDGDGGFAPIEEGALGAGGPPLPPGSRAEITVEALQRGGKVRDTIPTYVSAGKNLGKKNATNAISQALRDALGLYNKHLKRVDIVGSPQAEVPANAGADEEEAEEAEGADGDEGDDGEGPALSEGPKSGRKPKPAPAAPVTKTVGEARKPAAGRASRGPATPAEFDPMPPPMLVKRAGETRDATLTPADFKDGVTVQHKFNGVRFVAFARDGGLVRYSRAGTEYPGQEQVVAELLPMALAAPPIAPGAYGTPALGAAATEADRRILEAYGALGGGAPTPYLDGELYAHGRSLNWISGQARKGEDEKVLAFYVFDVFFPQAKWAGHDMPSRHRQAYLDAFFATAAAKAAPHPHVVRVENYAAAAPEEVERLAKSFVAEGYEGAIARKDGAGYVYGYNNYHASALIKIKPKLDAEFPVVGFTEGRRGKEVGAVVWECEVPNPVDPKDRRFAVVPKNLTYPERYALFRCLGQTVTGADGRKTTRFDRDLKGKPLTVEFAELSAKTGKPLQAKALIFRTYEGGPARDPVRAVLEECAKAAAATGKTGPS